MSAFEKFVKFCMAFAVMLLVACSNYTDTCDRKAGVTVGCTDTAITTDSGNTGDSEETGTPTETGDSDDTEETATETGNTNEDTDSGGDTDTDTSPELTPEQECWADMPLSIQFRSINHSKADLVDADWTGLSVVDTDQIQILDASTSSTLTAFWDPRYACGSAPEGQSAYMPDSYTDPMLGEEAHNRIGVALQPDGSIFEFSYLASCGGGEFQGYILPDADAAPLNACDGDIPNPGYWFGGHGGSHFTASQTFRPGELTGSTPIGRPGVIEVDFTHLKCLSSGDPNACFRWPAMSADSNYTSYSGTVDDLQMGSILTLADGYDCTALESTPGERLCEVMRDYGLIIVDDTAVANRVSISMSVEADAEFEVSEGYSPGDALSTERGYDTPFGRDVETLMIAAKVLTNPEEAWIE